MSKIIVTGGAGFIGSELAKRLSDDGKEVLIIDNLSYGHLDNVPKKLYEHFICMDVRDKRISKYFARGDVVFHFAGIAPLPDCQADSNEAFDVNVGGVGNVLDCMRESGASRIIFASSSAIYENATKFPCKESDKIVTPTLTYPLTKYVAEQLIKSYEKCFGVPYTMLRFYNVYGPHQDFRRKHPPFLGYVLKCALDNETPTFFSNGNHRRDYIFSEDLIDLCVKVLENKASLNQIFNVTSGKNYSVKEIYALLESAIGRKLPKPKFGDPMKFWDRHEMLFNGYYKMNKKIVESEVKKNASGSNARARKLLNWRPKTDMIDGIRLCYDFCVNNR